MIEIVIRGGESLDLPEDFTLNIVDENPLFLQDEIPSTYSVKFEVPETPRNIRLFGNPQRIASNALVKTLPADIRHFGYVIARGELLLSGGVKKPKLQFAGRIIPVDLQKNLNQIELGEYDYGDFPLVATDIDYADAWADDYRAAMINAAKFGNPFAVAPMKIKDTEWEGEELAEGAKNTVKQYINYWNAEHESFYINKVGGVLYEPNTRAHTPILPMPYLWEIIDAVLGDILISNPFTEGDFAKIVLPTFNHKYYSYDNLLGYYPDHDLTPILFFNPLVEDYEYNGTQWRDLMFRMKSFQQAYPFIELLKNLLKIFGMTLFTGYKYSIERNDDIMNREVVVDWSNKITGTPEKMYEAARDYVFSYGDKKPVNTVNAVKLADMAAIYTKVYNGWENVDYIVQDESTGGIYKMNMIIMDNQFEQRVIRTEVIQSPMSVVYNETGREKYEVISDVKPIEQTIQPIWWDEAPNRKFHWYVPEIELQDIKQPPYLMFRGEMTKVFGSLNTYPQLQAHNYDQYSVKRFDFSLLPGGADGLVSKFHSKFKEWVEKDKLRLKALVKLTPAELRNLNMRDKYYIDGKKFYIEKLEYTLKNNGISLVEADLVEC